MAIFLTKAPRKMIFLQLYILVWKPIAGHKQGTRIKVNNVIKVNSFRTNKGQGKMIFAPGNYVLNVFASLRVPILAKILLSDSLTWFCCWCFLCKSDELMVFWSLYCFVGLCSCYFNQSGSTLLRRKLIFSVFIFLFQHLLYLCLKTISVKEILYK